ncbi:class I SAM-dependent methyltransferase [Catellatospora sp. KI3]|uniref:class I SAM-dependent methyltransferase n=1 Tax=Catellatospora sp. KI3 TaxID=3041620 RepID=UPI002482E1DA|nr:class I SAM-dependent methyltransferase [Catellatospora sp. KI3]MDI1461170.1 class I SAM-dependent methyltransferase [Catellatospora sp. KI3]
MSGEFDEAYWEDRYRDHAGPGAGHPNPQLAAEVAGLAPGTALEAGCGEGADAVWLAARGWRVDAVDISPTALDRARARAEAVGADLAARVAWTRADLANWTPNREYDLVCTGYVHTPGSPLDLYARLAAAVAPGGTLLIVGHHPADHHSHGAHGATHQVHVTPEQVAAALDPARWDVVVAETRQRAVVGHGGEIMLHDTVVRARRRA